VVGGKTGIRPASSQMVDENKKGRNFFRIVKMKQLPVGSKTGVKGEDFPFPADAVACK
jgi:hypothetical protein